jgi:hypothetical protein
MKFAFLFLTYDNIYNSDVLLNFIGNDNLYIHPKFPNKINNNMKKYVINNLVPTKWGDYSIVKATLNLLKEAYNNKENDYFILLSSDSYPLFNKNIFKKNFMKLDKNMSTFFFIKKIDIFYKSRQWWILTRTDANIILNTINKYSKLFINTKINISAVDEIYFLSVLYFENSSYKYNNYNIIYSKWIKYSRAYHPITINKVTNIDLKEIKESKAFFIRKVLNNFSLTPIKYKDFLYIICVGDLTNNIEQLNIFINYNKLHSDFIILCSNKNNNLKIKLDNILYIYYTNYKYFYNNFFEICVEYSELFKKYINGIIFITETFILDDIIINNNIINSAKNLLYINLKDFKNNDAYYTLLFSSNFKNKDIIKIKIK